MVEGRKEEVGFRGWVYELDLWVGFMGWVQELDLQVGIRGWDQGLGLGVGFMGWVYGLGLGVGFRGWVYGLGLWVGFMGWDQGLGLGIVYFLPVLQTQPGNNLLLHTRNGWKDSSNYRSYYSPEVVEWAHSLQPWFAKQLLHPLQTLSLQQHETNTLRGAHSQESLVHYQLLILAHITSALLAVDTNTHHQCTIGC